MHCVYFPPEVGGLESHVRYLCRSLVGRGHQVNVVTSLSQPGLPQHQIIDGISVWRTWIPSRNTFGWATYAVCSTPKLVALGQEADVLHAQDIASVLPCIIAKRRRKTPIVTTYHTSHFLKRAKSLFWRPVFRTFLRMADHNLAASAEIASVGKNIAPQVDVEPLTNGVDTSIFRKIDPILPHLEEGGYRLIIPRRLFSKNGVEYFVRALPMIRDAVNVEAIVVGDGPERGRLESLAGKLGVTDHLTFMGVCPHDKMPGLLSSSDLAVFPSLMEATSIAALESMACEVPVAASRIGGLPEILDHEVGALFEPADPESLAETVIALLKGGQLRKLGLEARKRVVERWSNERLTDRHLEIYEDLLARRHSVDRVAQG